MWNAPVAEITESAWMGPRDVWSLKRRPAAPFEASFRTSVPATTGAPTTSA